MRSSSTTVHANSARPPATSTAPGTANGGGPSPTSSRTISAGTTTVATNGSSPIARRCRQGLTVSELGLQDPLLGAAQQAQREHRRRQQRQRGERDLHGDDAVLGPVDVVELEQERRLVEGQRRPDAERDGQP